MALTRMCKLHDGLKGWDNNTINPTFDICCVEKSPCKPNKTCSFLSCEKEIVDVVGSVTEWVARANSN